MELNYPDTVEWSASILDGGNLITTGNTWHNATQKVNIVTTKTDQGGSIVWQTEYNGTSSGFDYGAALIKDGSGNIFVAGATHASDDYTYDIVVIKYNSSGVQQRATTFDGTGNANDIPSDILLIGTDIYICAASIGTTTGYDYVLLKLNSSGTVQWNQRYDYTSLYDIPGHLATNGSNVVVSGASQSSATNWDYTSLKYNSSGTLIQTNRSSAAGYGFDRPTGMVTDDSDNFYISGLAYNGTDYDMRTIKLDDDLSPEWTVTENDGAEDGSNAICIDGSANIYIAGYAENTAYSKQMKIVKYNSGGTLQWEKILQNSSNDIDAEATGITFNATNNRVLVTGYYTYSTGKKTITTFALNASTGNIAWKKEFPNIGESIDIPTNVLANNNFIWVYGRRTVEDTIRYVTVKYETYEQVSEYNIDTTFIKNQIIIGFEPSVINSDFVNNKQQEFGNLANVINSTTYNQILPFLKGTNQQFSPKAIKIYKRMVEADTISIARMGDTVEVPKFWADILVTVDPSVNLQNTIDSINSHNYIFRGAFKNRIFQFNDVPNDASYDDDQSSLHPTLDFPNADINIEPVWDVTDNDLSEGNAGIKIGVYDSGLNWAHEDFGNGTFGGSKVGGGWDFVDNVAISDNWENDDVGHGSVVAGIVGALRNNGTGIAGIAGGDVDNDDNTGCQLIAMKIGDEFGLVEEEKIMNAVIEGSVYDPISGYGYGLNISNHSWSGPPETDSHGYLYYGFSQAFINQMICSAASGNSYNNDPRIPASFDDDWILKVGANNIDGDRAEFSTFGNSLDLIAPGVHELYIGIDNSTTTGYTDLLDSGNPIDGSSFAAPHVSGVAGLMLSYINYSSGTWNDLAPEDVEELMQLYTTDVDAIGYDDETGFGRLNAGNIFTEILLPIYQVRHFEPIVSTVTANKIEDNDLKFLNSSYGTLTGGYYFVDVYELTIAVLHDIDDATLLHFWDLDSRSQLWGNYGDVIIPVPQIVLESCDETSATITGYFYHFETTLTGASVNKWYPVDDNANVRLAYTLHIEDLNASNIHPNPTLTSEAISIFPNPATSEITVHVNSNSLNDFDRIKLYDASGRLILNEEIQLSNEGNITKNIHSLSRGLYLIRLESPDQNLQIKWIKQ